MHRLFLVISGILAVHAQPNIPRCVADEARHRQYRLFPAGAPHSIRLEIYSSPESTYTKRMRVLVSLCNFDSLRVQISVVLFPLTFLFERN